MIPINYEALVQEPSIAGRIIVQDRSFYSIVLQNQEEVRGQISGAMRHLTMPADLPVVGDYVALRIHGEVALIERVLPRQNLFARRGIDQSHLLQPIAANLDTLFVTLAVNKDFDVRRLERYVVAARAYEVPIAIVLTKTDLVQDALDFVRMAREVAENIPVLAVSATEARGLEFFDEFRGTERTIAFVGSSGAGKSTLINQLCKSNLLEVNEIRARDDRGKHTTTRRMMLHLDDGTAIIDTPGMREFALADASEGLSHAFQDIGLMAEKCKFRDCHHKAEPGCAVRDAIDEARLNSWRKLGREAAFEARKTDRVASLAEKEKWKSIHKDHRSRERERNHY